jgi:hypothetical protein
LLISAINLLAGTINYSDKAVATSCGSVVKEIGMDDFIDRALPELRTLVDAIRSMSMRGARSDEPELTALIYLCQRVMRQRDGLPLIEYLRSLGR